MPNFASECYNAGLFSILAVVLNENAPGYQIFRKQSKDSWKKLGVDQSTIDAIVLKKQSPENAKKAFREEFPVIIEKSYGEKGRSFYEVGFWTGTVFLGIMANLKKEMSEWLKSWKYKCAEIGNPKLLSDFIKNCEDKLAKGEDVDITEMSRIVEEVNLWIIANGKVEKRQDIMDVIITSSSAGIPYVGKLISAIYKRFKSK